jgi:Putative Actinobacterial Holin-X, holin superfamily III
MTERVDNRSLGDLVAELTQDLGRLIRQEMELARRDFGSRLSEAGRSAGLVAAGSSLALGGLFVLLAAAVLALATVGLDAWVAALLVGVGSLAVGYLFVRTGLSRMKRRSMVPARAIESIKEDAKWVTGQKA